MILFIFSLLLAISVYLSVCMYFFEYKGKGVLEYLIPIQISVVFSLVFATIIVCMLVMGGEPEVKIVEKIVYKQIDYKPIKLIVDSYFNDVNKLNQLGVMIDCKEFEKDEYCNLRFEGEDDYVDPRPKTVVNPEPVGLQPELLEMTCTGAKEEEKIYRFVDMKDHLYDNYINTTLFKAGRTCTIYKIAIKYERTK